MGWTFYNSSGEALTNFGPTDVTDIDINGATDVGEAIVDADQFVIYNTSATANRKAAASSVVTYINKEAQVVTAHGYYGGTYNLQSNSVNIASVSKDSTGIGTVTFTSNYANSNYGMGVLITGGNVAAFGHDNTTSSFKVETRNFSGSVSDSGARFNIAGPLA